MTWLPNLGSIWDLDILFSPLFGDFYLEEVVQDPVPRSNALLFVLTIVIDVPRGGPKHRPGEPGYT